MEQEKLKQPSVKGSQNEPLVIRWLPSNSTEGMMFDDLFCSHCSHEKFMHTQNHDDKQCEILNNALLNEQPCKDRDLNLDGWKWFTNADYSKVKCETYIDHDWDNDNGRPTPKPDPNQLVLFSFSENLDEILKEKETV